MDNKEQARVKAETKCVELAYSFSKPDIQVGIEMYIVSTETEEFEFPFADLKDGDACSVEYDNLNTILFFYNGSYYESYADGEFRIRSPYDLHVIKKLNFNILEHLEEK